MRGIELREETGWTGAFTRNQLLGAWSNGTRVTKMASKEGDGVPNGTPGTVLGSLAYPGSTKVLYFVEWSVLPRVAVAVMGSRIRFQAPAPPGPCGPESGG